MALRTNLIFMLFISFLQQASHMSEETIPSWGTNTSICPFRLWSLSEFISCPVFSRATIRQNRLRHGAGGPRNSVGQSPCFGLLQRTGIHLQNNGFVVIGLMCQQSYPQYSTIRKELTAMNISLVISSAFLSVGFFDS